jgi:hypothetical protein
MPCYRCGVRQVDPVRGHSPWQRGVRGDQQVLVCPDCQRAPGLTADLDRCRKCGGVRLVRRLGEVECRGCGFVAPPEGAAAVELTLPAERAGAERAGVASAGDGGAPEAPGGGTAPGLAEEVALALDRVLGRAGAEPSASAAIP